jgi:hypothetical protein
MDSINLALNLNTRDDPGLLDVACLQDTLS